MNISRSARAYRTPHTDPNAPGRLKFNESDAFKSELMVRTSWWSRDRVPLPAFRQACLDAGLSGEDTAKLFDYLKRCQDRRTLIKPAARFREGATFDGVIRAAGLPIDENDPPDFGVPSEDW